MRNKLIFILGLLVIITASLGVFYTNGGSSYNVTNIYGDTVKLYGDGIYANNSILKVGTTKGTDVAIILFSVLMILCTILEKKFTQLRFYKTGLLAIILYISICMSMGVSLNRLFLLYLVEFSLALYLLIFEMSDILKQEYFPVDFYANHLKGLAIFLMISGCSVLIWLFYIIPSILTGAPFETIEIYTTEPTFLLDLGIILPACIMCGIWLLKRKRIGYYLAPILLTILSCVAIAVILQTLVQIYMGILLRPSQYAGLVGSFVVLGTIAAIINHKLLRNVQVQR